MQIDTIDLLFQDVPNAIGVFLVRGETGTVLIETGPTSTLPACLDALAKLGVQPTDVQAVIVTHIHFDHAGACGWWAEQGAHIYVHERGARHLIDPSILVASATQIYGDMMDVLWGEMKPISAENVTSLTDNDIIEVGDLKFKALDTPGHARHHHALLIEDVIFAGDTAGGRLPGGNYITLTAPPPQFDPIGFENSLNRLAAINPRQLYLTHFGPIDDVQDHIVRYKKIVKDSAELVRDLMQQGYDRDAIAERYLAHAKQRAMDEGVSAEQWQQYETAVPQDMNVDGIMLYWKRLDRRKK